MSVYAKPSDKCANDSKALPRLLMHKEHVVSSKRNWQINFRHFPGAHPCNVEIVQLFVTSMLARGKRQPRSQPKI